jgi:hypothetical protein
MNTLICKANRRAVGEYELAQGIAHVFPSLHTCPAAATLDAACKTELRSVGVRRNGTLRRRTYIHGAFIVAADVVSFVEEEWHGAQWFASEPVRLERQLALGVEPEQLYAPVFLAFLGDQIVAMAAPGVEQ